MTTHATSLNVFVLRAQEGRTREPLDLLGQKTLMKLTNSDTNGAAAIFHQTIPRMSGPPLHRHSREDEWFYVLDGEITAEIDGERIVLRGGDSAFAPRGTAHTFRNFGNTTAQMLALVMPGAFNDFFEELCTLHRGLSAPDLVLTEQLANQYGIELLGPPLA
ncbi:MAG TPA: cupin domain-containing protein [Bryobacteraceae bacterium]|nr:cupin domain-containing protein [Bryobacteraceae bacterium]